jgi:small GTP-binding protein
MQQPMESMKARVCLVGESGVGKTSLVRRFVFNEFDDRYIQTLGAKVVRKDVSVELDGHAFRVVLTILDIMGEPEFRDLLKEAYFHEVQGIVAVGDLTRPDTVRALPEWIGAARRVSGPVPITVLGNKADLPVADGAPDAVQEVADAVQAPTWLTSSKTGVSVDAAFVGLSQAIVTEGFRAWERGPIVSLDSTVGI